MENKFYVSAWCYNTRGVNCECDFTKEFNSYSEGEKYLNSLDKNDLDSYIDDEHYCCVILTDDFGFEFKRRVFNNDDNETGAN